MKKSMNKIFGKVVVAVASLVCFAMIVGVIVLLTWFVKLIWNLC